jgi:hypothetical protein
LELEALVVLPVPAPPVPSPESEQAASVVRVIVPTVTKQAMYFMCRL